MSNPVRARDLLAAFRRFSLLEDGAERTIDIIEALESETNILPLLRNPTSFSDLFTSFAMTQEIGKLRPRIATFSRLASIIESVVRPFEVRNEEPQELEKKFLLPILSRFVVTMPSLTELERWLAE